jgi:hypothetical protein
LAVIYDVVIDTFLEENVKNALAVLGTGRLLLDKDDPEEPFLLGDEAYLVVRIKDQDPVAFARELERRVSFMRIVKVVDRTPTKE